MLIRAGYRIELQCDAAIPMVLLMSVHPTQRERLREHDRPRTDPAVLVRPFRDPFGNVAHRLTAPAGRLRLESRFLIEDDGLPDPIGADAAQHPVDCLPDATLQFLLPSRYCDTEHLMDLAWREFGHLPEGWARVQAVTDFVHQRIRFGYAHASATRTASMALGEGRGVCRDYAHLAIALCRCMGIPARYVNGWLGDIRVPPVPDPMDFSAWFQVWLGDRWWDFDARHNVPRVGRILIAAGRDAADVAMITSWGPSRLTRFEVIAEEVEPEATRAAA